MSTPRTLRHQVAVFGDPIQQSLSPDMHTAAFKALGMDKEWEYSRIRVTKQDLASALREAADSGYVGVNLTIPHKEAACKLMELTPSAERIGAVNTVTFSNGKMKGDSTDGAGFLLALKEGTNITPDGKRVVILGAGGGARSIAYTLADQGASEIVFVNRSPDRADKLAEILRQGTKAKTNSYALDRHVEWKRILADVDILINTTPIGMKGENSPVSEDALHSGLVVVDLEYNPPMNDLLRIARKHGLKAINGAGMLVHQGALSFEIWTDRKPELSVMRKALDDAVAKLEHAASKSSH